MKLGYYSSSPHHISFHYATKNGNVNAREYALRIIEQIDSLLAIGTDAKKLPL
ncbi:hypothetical protein [Zunongwangia endophytica]|uniref:hypothetical protein n=1 Tax=Zunongwangia endophytica TaxID=1808945 RepID=UPI00338F0F61